MRRPRRYLVVWRIHDDVREAAVVVDRAEQVRHAGRREDEVFVDYAGSSSNPGCAAVAHDLLNRAIKIVEKDGFDLIGHEVDG